MAELTLKPEPKPFVAYSDYKGKPTMTIGIDNGNPFSKLSFGKAKARMMVANIDAIKEFANTE